MVAGAFCEPEHNKVALGARKVTGEQAAEVEVACKPADERPQLQRTLRNEMAEASRRCPRDTQGRNTFLELEVVVDKLARSKPVEAAATAPVVAVHTVPRVRVLLEAHSAGAARALLPRTDALAAGMPKTGPATAQAAAG